MNSNNGESNEQQLQLFNNLPQITDGQFVDIRDTLREMPMVTAKFIYQIAKALGIFRPEPDRMSIQTCIGQWLKKNASPVDQIPSYENGRQIVVHTYRFEDGLRCIWAMLTCNVSGRFAEHIRTVIPSRKKITNTLLYWLECVNDSRLKEFKKEQ